MRRRFYSLMMAALAIPFIFSCVQKEEMDPDTQKDNIGTTRYEYRFEIAEDKTRALLTDQGVFWEIGDQVGVFVGSGSSVAAEVNTENSPKTIEFSTDAPLESETLIHAYYPFLDNNASVSASKVIFPRNQQGGSVSAMPMVGIPTVFQEGESNGVIHFLNLGSIIDFRVYSASHTDEQIQSIKISVTSGSNPISGDATLDLTGVERGNDASMSVNWPVGVSSASSVSLLRTAGVAASKDLATEPLYMVVAPGTYSGSILIVTDAASYSFSFTEMEFGRNGIKRFNMNLDGSKVVRSTLDDWYEKVTSAEQLTGSDEYLIIYESGSKVFKPILSGSSALDNTANNVFGISIENNRVRVTDDVDACRVVFESANQSGKYYMKAVEVGDYYFYPSSSKIVATKNQRSATAVSVSFVNGTGGTVNITAGSNNYFKYSSSSNCFKQSTSNSSRELALYKKHVYGGPKTQPLSFSPASVQVSLTGKTVPFNLTDLPELTGLKTRVAYYLSSDPVVATVDASGVVEVRGAGKTVITVVAEPDDNYVSSTASYTLTILEAGLYCLENDKVGQFFDYVEEHPYNPSDYSYSYVTRFNSNVSSTNRLDLPKPVPVSWTTSSAGTTQVIVYDESGQEEKTANVTVTSSTSADIYSLIPGRAYTYVVKDNDVQIAEGSFKTYGRRRMIKVAESPYGETYANNCRDFGGLLTNDGRVVKFGKIYRGTNMDGTTSAQKTYLTEYMGVGLDVDLRETTGANPLGVTVSDQVYNSIDHLKNADRMMITIGDILDAVAAGTGVYIHCKVGADRTGYVCMLLEAILGVRQDLCDIDYELTSFSCVGTRERGNKSATYYYYPRGIEFISGMDGNTFQEKAVNYVVNTLGISRTRVEAFQSNMLEELN